VAGRVVVIESHQARPPPPRADASASVEEPLGGRLSGAAVGDNAARPACAAIRAKLLARIFEMQGMQVEPELAAWLERNLDLGTSGVKTIQVLGGDPLLLTALKVDGVARGLAEDLARCERP
jgi:hypothetical protein